MPTQKRRESCGALIAAVIIGASIWSPAIAIAATNTLVDTGNSAGNCNNAVQSAINQAAQNIQEQAQNTYSQIPAPANLASSTCFSNILNMGPNIGLSFFSPATLLQELSQMVCNAAQQALQWPVQQAYNTVNNYGSLPYGMGGVMTGQGGNGVSVNTYNSSGPNIGSIPMGNGSILGNALGG